MTTSAQASTTSKIQNNCSGATSNNNETTTTTAAASTTTTSTLPNSDNNCIKLELSPTPTAAMQQQQPQQAQVNQQAQVSPRQLPSPLAPQVQLSVTNASAASSSALNRVMNTDEEFNVRFVNLVRLHRCLYDKKVPEYRNRDNQEKAWMLISQETRESVIHCKERWRNLRACLSRYIKQQSGSEPQHKPYYLTEYMAFLLPFLKSARSSLEGNNSLATLYQLSQQEQHTNPMALLTTIHGMNTQEKFELKQSLSENDDEETIDAFDPAITASLGLQRISTTGTTMPNTILNAHLPVPVPLPTASPALSDTASANTLQNFIPDVQLAESGQDLVYTNHIHHPHHQHSRHKRRLSSHEYEACSSTPVKRIKTECEATTSGQYYGLGGSGSVGGGNIDCAEHADMEFFRSILPDLASLTPQQKRKFKIGILELIDDVVERYPSNNNSNSLDRSGSSSAIEGQNGQNIMANGLSNGNVRGRQQRRSSARDSSRK